MGERIDKLKGKMKEVWGTATGDRKQEVEGKAEQLKGEVKRGYEDVKRDIRDVSRKEPES